MPPRITTKPWAYFRNISLRTKKYRKLMPRFTRVQRVLERQLDPQPTDVPPASLAPRLAASMIRGRHP
jgi:hypothetical protein